MFCYDLGNNNFKLKSIVSNKLTNNEIEKTLSSLVKNGFLKPSAVVAIERDSKSKRLNWPLGLKELKERKYGAATIFYAEPANEE